MIDDTGLRQLLIKHVETLKDREKFTDTAQKEVAEYMAKTYNVKYGYTSNIFKGLEPIDIMPYDMLYKLMDALKNESKLRSEYNTSELKEELFFNPPEIKLYEKPLNKKEVYSDTAFEPFLNPNRNKFAVDLPVVSFERFIDSGQARYNPETQRDLIKVTSDGIEYMAININNDSVNDIYKLLESGDYDCDPITLNINTDINLDEDMLPKVRGNKLIIPSGAIIDIIDGWHRTKAILKYKRLHPDWDFKFTVQIVMWSTKKAKEYVVLQDMKNHLTKQQITRDNKNDEANFIINRLRGDGDDFHIRKTINDDMAYNLNIIINELFNPKNRKNDSMPLLKKIFKNINDLVEENNWYDKSFTKQEWLIYLYTMKIAEEKNIRFIDLVNRIKIDDEIIKNTDFGDKISVGNMRTLRNVVEEAIRQ
jgi:hypothetical protein